MPHGGTEGVHGGPIVVDLALESTDLSVGDQAALVAIVHPVGCFVVSASDEEDAALIPLGYRKYAAPPAHSGYR